MKPTADDRRQALRRAAAREREAARIVGSARVHRGRASAPDVRPVVLEHGRGTIGIEVKHRKNLPAVILAALAQARGYFARGTICVGVISQRGGEAIACLPLRDLAQLLGLAEPELPRPRRRRPPSQPQLTLFGVEREVGGQGAPPTVHTGENPDGPVTASGCPQDAPPAGAPRRPTPPPATPHSASAAGGRGGIVQRDLKPDNTRRATR